MRRSSFPNYHYYYYYYYQCSELVGECVASTAGMCSTRCQLGRDHVNNVSRFAAPCRPSVPYTLDLSYLLRRAAPSAHSSLAWPAVSTCRPRHLRRRYRPCRSLGRRSQRSIIGAFTVRTDPDWTRQISSSV